jgi:lipopolysaccharide/colanic/teichoic acid biosynthesis glycosyltransferase
MLKRGWDIVVAGSGLVIISPLLIIAAVLVKLTSRGPVLFRHERIGLGGRPFKMLKFRTMVQDAPAKGGPITFGDDPRITSFGKVLRRTKIDEMPQLVNVLKGDMSLVGPRPEVAHYVEMFRADYEEILRVRPGMTDLASIRYIDEATILGEASDPEAEYVHRVLPEKIRLAKEYVRRQSFLFDLTIIFGTFFRMTSDYLPRSRPNIAKNDSGTPKHSSGESQPAGGNR